MFTLGNLSIGRKHHKSSGDRRRQQEVRAAYQKHLRLEPLEDRHLLSVFTVTNVLDSGAGSLRQAITDANNHVSATADTIQFASAVTGKITLTSGELGIEDPVNIQGPGAANLTIDAGGKSRVFNVDDGDSSINIKVQIDGLTLTGGSATIGGGILSYESLTLSNSIVTGNTATSGGGGIWAYTYAGGTMSIQNSTISGNTATGAASSGGGLYATDYGTTNIQNSTISGNSAVGDGGGIWAKTYAGGATTLQNSTISGNQITGTGSGGGIWAENYASGAMTVQNSTISGNSATGAGSTGGTGGGIYLFNYGAATIQNSTITGNTAKSGGGGMYSYYDYSASTVTTSPTIQSTIIAGNTDTSGASPDLSGPVTISHSLVGDNTGSPLTAAPVGQPDNQGNLIGTSAGVIDAQLGPLTNNGGPTLTHALLSSSPAIDMGANPAGLTTDQRGTGFIRQLGTQVDIGAFEAPAASPPEIGLQGLGHDIADGDTTPSLTDGTDFGSVALGGAALTRTFRVENTGTGTLTLGTPSLPAGYTITESLDSTILPGGSDTFTVQLSTATVGTFAGNISIVSNDSNENPFNFRITGTVLGIPAIGVQGSGQDIADGDSVPSATDGTDFGSALQNGAVLTRTFTVFNTGTADLTLGTLKVPTGYTITEPLNGTIPAQGSDTFTVQLSTANVGTFAGDISFSTNVTGENPFNFAVTGTVVTVPIPQIVVEGLGQDIADGDATPRLGDGTDFGSALVNGAALLRTFLVQNTGTADLILGTLTLPAGYTLTEPLDGTIAAGGSDTFTVQLDTASAGTFAGDISFTTNVTGKTPFSFAVTGNVTVSPVTAIVVEGLGQAIADGDAVPSPADGTDFGSAMQNAAALTQTFTVRNTGTTALTLGTPKLPAGYTITEALNKTIAAGDSDTFTVQLSTATAGTFAGDISFTNNVSGESPFNFAVTGTVTALPVAKIVVQGLGHNIANGDMSPNAKDGTNLGLVSRTGTLTQTFTVLNGGTDTLVLGTPSLPAAYTLVEPLKGTLAPGESDTFTVQLSTAAVGTFAGEISIATNDPNASIFNFRVRGRVMRLPAEISVLAGATNMSSGQAAAIDVGSAVWDTAGPTMTFTIRNDGDKTLKLTTPFASTAHFTVGKPGKASLAAGTATTFTVTLNTDAIWSGSEQISFVNSDTDNGDGVESPYAFLVSGTVTAPVHAPSTIGGYDPTASVFYLRNMNSAGPADINVAYGPAKGGWTPIMGDWNGDGIDTVGLYNPTTSMFYLRNSNTGGYADVTFVYGPAGGDWTPIVGDWNGDGIDTVGLYNSVTSTFYLRNSNTGGYADVTFVYGPAGGDWTPIVGDWNGDHVDTIGLYNPTSSVFYLRNSNSGGYAQTTFAYGPAGGGWTPVVGDWNGNGVDTIGLDKPSTSTFYLRYTNDQGMANRSFDYTSAKHNWIPLAGVWAGGEALLAAGGPVAAAANVSTLDQADLQPIISEAIARWTGAGLDAATIAKLTQVQFVISDLPGSYLGEAETNRIYIDGNAAGYGWFVDPTPALDEEFAAAPGSQQLQAVDPKAVDRIDLLTVVEHELGHIAGFDDLDALAASVMNGVLGTGVRRNA